VSVDTSTISERAAQLADRYRSAAGADRLPDTPARLLVLDRLAAGQFRASPLRLPTSIEALYPAQLERILATVSDPESIIDLGTDPWRKNLLILSGGLVPVGAEFADPSSGIPRSTLLRGGVGQSLRLAATIALQTGGFRPCLELHAHPDSLEDFNVEGWERTYHRLAELMAENPQFKAVIASSWFRDPALATISPRLGYLREFPCRHGAGLYVTGRDEQGTSGALARSPTRRRLFECGQYVPTIHLLVWPRSTLLGWHFSKPLHS